MANQTMTPEQQQAAMGQAYNNAYQTLVDQVWGPVYFQKLAQDWGVSPETQEDAEKLVALAHRLRAGHQHEVRKQASARSSVLDRALSDVDLVLQHEGVGASKEAEFVHQAKEVAASVVQQNPTLRDAALLYQDFLANALQN